VPEEKRETLTRIYTIPLDIVMASPRHKRAKRAISAIKEFAVKNMKSEEIKIEPELNLTLWNRGIRNPPKRVTVKMERDEDGVVTISPAAEEKDKGQ
jgi:large subunit ribosomal protein L31e